ncbi:MMPL family transporter [Streptomyces sp. p1417]|uniref:MMPL family transporter n=1 Tax=Streptomyces typhae TaxID=2681492 RepID=A0A6L6WVG9_9ACTN|nr:MMPL family transporter [Streptomyces typhae]MVO85569.1 MMPL family transporter [Streptomyces typhae]
MSTFLYRLGLAAFRWRGRVALLWVAVLAAVGLGALGAGDAPEDEGAIPGIESRRAFDLIDERFPGSAADGASARIVFVAPGGERVTAAGYRAAVGALVAEVGRGSQVADVTGPLTGSGAGTDDVGRDQVSEDRSTAYATVTYKVTADDLTGASKDALERAVERARDSGLTVETGGDAVTSEAAGGLGEILGFVVAAGVLLITFGSLAAAGLPLVSAVVGVGLSMAAIMALGGVLGLSSSTGELALMIGIAVGVDYALFVVSRYREERAGGHDPRRAAGLAVGTAGSAVVFAGLTVVIALAGLSVIGVPTLTRMGLTAAGAVVIAVLVTLTLVPALLGFWPEAVRGGRRGRGRTGGTAGRRFRTRWFRTRAFRTREFRTRRTRRAEDRRMGVRWARFVLRRPVPVLLASVAALGALAVPALDLRLGMPGDEAKPTSTSERRAYDALADGFGPGFNGPLTVVVDARNAGSPEDAAASVGAVADRIAATEGVVAVSPPRFNAAEDTAVLRVTPATAPTSERTKDLVRTIRDERPRTESATGATFEVTGTTALNIDVAQKMTAALIPYLLVVVGLAFLLLTVVFRSLLVPLKAALGFLLSVAASFGALVTVFQNGHGAALLGIDQTGPVMSQMPLVLVGIVFGLAMDYQVFLVSRMREAYVRGSGPGDAVVAGFRHSGRVVVAAALIMTCVFAGFMTGGETLLKMVGFGLAVAVLFDAFVVRMALVPAALVLLGDRAWWLPRAVGRLLPRVDVEGEALTRAAVPRPAADAPALAASSARQDSPRGAGQGNDRA